MIIVDFNGTLMNRDIVIEKLKLNKRLKGNEDLLDAITDVALERLESVVGSLKDEQAINTFIDKTISKAILDVLKEHNRYGNINKKLQKIDYKLFNNIIEHHTSPTLSINKLKQLYGLLKKSDENIETTFLEILNKKYKEKLTLCELATAMNITKDEVVNILFEMSEYSNKVARI